MPECIRTPQVLPWRYVFRCCGSMCHCRMMSCCDGVIFRYRRVQLRRLVALNCTFKPTRLSYVRIIAASTRGRSLAKAAFVPNSREICAGGSRRHGAGATGSVRILRVNSRRRGRARVLSQWTRRLRCLIMMRPALQHRARHFCDLSHCTQSPPTLHCHVQPPSVTACNCSSWSSRK